MKREAFVMQLKPGFEAEYRRRHDALWPEMAKALKEAGVFDYSIFLDPASLRLFAVQKLTDDNESAKLPSLAIVRKWWDYMADIMETNPDHSPVCLPLDEVFYFP